MLEKCDSSKGMVAPSSMFYGKIWVGFCLKHWKTLFLGGFIFKPTERA